KRVPTLHEQLLERSHGAIRAEEGLEQFLSTLDWQHVQPHLAVVRLAAPSMLVLGPVVHEQKQTRRAQTLDQTVQQRLSLAVDPVQILENHQEWLLASLAQQQRLHRVERVLATLDRVKPAPRPVPHRDVEERQERRQGRLQRAIEREQLAHHLFADLTEIVAVLDLEVALEQLDHRQVARRLAIGGGGTLSREPALQAMRVGELVDETRFTRAGLADDRGHLPVTAASELLGAAELLKLGIATDEPSQPLPGGRLQAGPRRAGTHHFVDLYGTGEAPPRDKAQTTPPPHTPHPPPPPGAAEHG